MLCHWRAEDAVPTLRIVRRMVGDPRLTTARRPDVFISHASEDKDQVARPLEQELRRLGLNVWFDESVLRVGDSLYGQVRRGLKACRHGIVVLSHDFFAKDWPQEELRALSARKIGGETRILPIWHGLSRDEVLSYDPLLADTYAFRTDEATVPEIAQGIVEEIRALDLEHTGPRHPIRVNRGPDPRLAYVERLRCVSRARLIERWLAVGVPEQTAQELADDSSVGTFPDKVPPVGVVALVGEFGAGKSVTAERFHGDDLDTYLDGNDQPIPVFLRARGVQATLEQSVNTVVPPGADVHAHGVRLVLDGLDEAGASRGAELLAEARVMVRAEPNTRVLITMRPGFDVSDEEKIVAPPLSDEILMDLSQRMTGHRHSLSSLSGPVKDAIRYPLFAIIALQQRARARELPSSRALFLETLVNTALGGTKDETMSSLDVLAAAASISIPNRGSLSERDLGGPDTVSTLLATRLVVRDGNSLRFALPILEQYFGAYALLHKHVDVDRVVGDLATFESWRYAFVVAVGVGVWADISRLLEKLGRSWPGAACWVIDQAVSEHGGRQNPAGPLPDSRECEQRLRTALRTWTSWLHEITPSTYLTDENGALVTVEAAISDGRLMAALVSSTGQPGNSNPINSRWGTPPPDEQGWPWRWAMDWVASAVKSLLEVRGLPLPSNEPLRAEREWSLARRLVGDRSGLHPPIDPQRVIHFGQLMLADLSPDPRQPFLHLIAWPRLSAIPS